MHTGYLYVVLYVVRVDAQWQWRIYAAFLNSTFTASLECLLLPPPLATLSPSPQKLVKLQFTNQLALYVFIVVFLSVCS